MTCIYAGLETPLTYIQSMGNSIYNFDWAIIREHENI